MSDRIFAGIWITLCIAGLFIGWQIQSEYSYEPLGPRPFPMVIIGLMLLCAVRLLVLVITLGLYAWSFEWLGFPLATTLLTASIGLLFGATIPAALLSGIVMGSILFYAFDHLLDVTLPLGVWLS